MLLFTREQFYLNFIQVYLQGGQSILQDGPHQVDSFQFDKIGLRSADRILFVLTAPEGQRKGHWQRQHFYLVVTAQKICANDNVKGVSVKHYAVLSQLLIAQTHGNIDPPQKMDGPTIPNPYGHGFGFPDFGLFQQSAGHD